MTIERGRLFIFEGPDGVGKTSLSQLYTRSLNEQGRNCKHVSFPGNRTGSLGSLVNRLHHDAQSLDVGDISTLALQMLHVAAHVEEINKTILPAIRDGIDIVLDRYWWSTWVYGWVGGLGKRQLRSILRPEIDAWHQLTPTAVMLIDRSDTTNPKLTDSHGVLKREYDCIAKAEAGKHPVIAIANDGDMSDALADIFDQIPSDVGHHSNEEKVQQPLPWNIRSGAPMVCSSLSPVEPSPVFDTYWRFAATRQQIFHKRIAGELGPWTNDPILKEYKFTNAYRASDRVSQYLIKNVIYEGDQSRNELFFRIMLFKLFNKIETWELLQSKLKTICWSEYRFDKYAKVIERARARGQTVYSGAYIMPSGRGAFGFKQKHKTHLKLLECMIKDELPDQIAEAVSMAKAFALLRAYPTIGDFLAYQYVTDINYSALTDFPEDRFVVPGPGAKDGIRKCFAKMGGLKESDLIRLMMDRQEAEFERLGLDFQSLWGRRLQLIDCQNLFCEVDKYARVAHPNIEGISGRTRIKQRFRVNQSPLHVWYPPKWEINDLISSSLANV